MRQETIRRLVSIGLLVLLTAIFGITSKYFFTVENIFNILRECAPIGIIAVGVTLVIITAGIDLSTGAIVGFTAMVSANLLYYYQVPALLIVLISIGLGILCGYLNGFLVTVLMLPDFIATLSTQFLFRGLALIFAIRTGGMITNEVIQNPGILILGGSIGGLYLVTIVFFLLALLGQFLLKATKFGTYVYATGANRKSAELSGIHTNKVKRAVYAITGFTSGLTSLFVMAKLGSVTQDTGTGLEFDVISAVVVGGCAFSGGRGDILGTVIGALFMAVLANGILKYDLPNATQLMIKGAVIIIMIIFDSVYDGMMQRKSQKSRLEEDSSGGIA